MWAIRQGCVDDAQPQWIAMAYTKQGFWHFPPYSHALVLKRYVALPRLLPLSCCYHSIFVQLHPTTQGVVRIKRG